MVIAQALAPPLSTHQVLVFLLQLGVLLLLALCLGGLARRLGLPAVAGELATGILLGPSILGRAAPSVTGWLLPARPDQAHLLEAFGEFAVLVLVGITAAQLDLRTLWRRRGVVTRVGMAGLVLPFGLGVGAGLLIPAGLVGASAHQLTFAGFLGVALGVSAIPVIAKTLADMQLLHRDVGQLTLSAAAVQDATGWFLLSLVSTTVVAGFSAGRLAVSVLELVGFVVLAALLGRPLVRQALRVAARSDGAGPVTATAVVVIVLGAAASQALGLGAVFGAFMAGALISAARPDPHGLAPLRTIAMAVLAPIFLAGAGLRIDLSALARPGVAVTAVAVLGLAVAGKLAGGYVGARLSRLGHWEGLAIGAGLNARGVVEVVVASVGLQLGILTVEMYTVVLLVAVVTSLMAPPLLRWAMARVEHSAEERLRHAEQRAWLSPGVQPGLLLERGQVRRPDGDPPGPLAG